MGIPGRFAYVLLMLLAIVPSTGVVVVANPHATPPASSNVPQATPGAALSPEQLLQYRPNEIGTVPILMYHNIMEDPEGGVTDENAHLYRTSKELRNDLLWLYDRDFYLIGMLDFINGTIAIPAGKHPVVLTFDDSSSMHFSIQVGDDGKPIRDQNGEVIPTPDCAVGIIEQFAKDHPDFGKTAHFAMIPVFKFSWPEYQQDEWVAEKMQWLMDHGYEIGNHTSDHVDLAAAEPKDFARIIAEPVIWSSELVDPKQPGYAMNVLTLPFGAYPEDGWTDAKLDYLRNGFEWEGHQIKIDAVLLVCCGPSPSRFSLDYSHFWIPRIRGDDPDFEALGAQIDRGDFVLYTSDGDPATIAVPWPLPSVQWGSVDFESIRAAGVEIIRYDPDTGRVLPSRERRGQRGYTVHGRYRIRA